MFDEIRKAVEGHFKQEWNSTPADTIEFENVPFSPPASGTWVRLVIIPGKTHQASIGESRDRCPGVLVVSVFAPKNSGSRSETDLAEDAGDIFRNLELNEGGTKIRFWEPRFRNPAEKKDYRQMNAVIQFLAEKAF